MFLIKKVLFIHKKNQTFNNNSKIKWCIILKVMFNYETVNSEYFNNTCKCYITAHRYSITLLNAISSMAFINRIKMISSSLWNIYKYIQPTYQHNFEHNKNIQYFKFAPITSCDVEISFSQFKSCLTNNQRSYGF